MIQAKELRFGNKVYNPKNAEIITVQQILHSTIIYDTQSKYAKGIKPELGKELTIYYMPSTPDKYYIPRSLPYEIIPIMLAIPGLIFCVFELLKIAHLFH